MLDDRHRRSAQFLAVGPPPLKGRVTAHVDRSNGVSGSSTVTETLLPFTFNTVAGTETSYAKDLRSPGCARTAFLWG